MVADPALRVAAVLLAVSGLGFGLSGAYGVWSLATGRGIATVMGFPAYGLGPFERVGIPSTAPLVAAFVIVCALEVVAAGLVWQARLAGGILAMALLVPGLVFWWGFALPFGPVLAIPRTILLLWRWNALA